MTLSTCKFIATCALWGMLGLLPAGIHPACAEPAAPKETPADAEEFRDPEALAELRRATDFLTALPRFHIIAVTGSDHGSQGTAYQPADEISSRTWFVAPPALGLTEA